MKRELLFIGLLLFVCLTVNASEKARPTIVLQRVVIPKTRYEMGMGIAVFPPNAIKRWRKAVGPEVCYVLQGYVTVRTQDKRVHRYRTGESFKLPANLVHMTQAGPGGAKVLAVWSHIPGQKFNYMMYLHHLN